MEKNGGKAQSLRSLRSAGFLVPEFFIISPEELENDNLTGIKRKIMDKTQSWDEEIIIRSSANCEDGKENSFAGLFESVIVKDKTKLNEYLKKIIDSGNSKKVQDYMKIKNIIESPKISLIVQKFIFGEVSGVIFNTEKEYIINSNFGTAESIVGGKACDEYMINKKDHKIILKNKESDSLQKEQIKRLIHTADKINFFFKSPQDIEWTIKKGDIYILQSRPITVFQKNQEVTVWDNSNIAESYSGIVLPLTCSFAEKMYSRVYRQVALASGVSKKRVENNKEIFDNMLGFFSGRFYYNMLNWYKMLTLFPGYERNKINFDRMISIKSKTELDKEYEKNVSKLFKTKYYLLILYKYATFDSSVVKFKEKIKHITEIFGKKNLANMSKLELLREFAQLENTLISIWHIPIENDFLAMTFYGLFIKKAKNMGVEEKEIISQISNMGGIRTVEQIKALIRLSKNPNEKDIEAYFKIYGGRFANELKLESQELNAKSKEFRFLLREYKDLEIKEHVEEKKINFGATGNFFLSETKKYLKQREDLRILRAKVYSLARNIFLEIGKRLMDEKIIQNYQDIFYLKLNELNENNLEEKVKSRKKEYYEFKKVNLENILYTNTTGKIITGNLNKQKSENGKIVGRPCSEGQIFGKATIIKNSSPPLNRKYEIIVTETADPGWAPVLSLCKGIIIEKGGILSHISILARELGIPCIINAPGITKKIKNNQKINMNGSTGEIVIGRNN